MNQQYLEIVGSLTRNCFYLLALDACQYTPPGHVIQASLVVGGYVTFIYTFHHPVSLALCSVVILYQFLCTECYGVTAVM